jgi:hypothetical protein
VSLRRPPLFRLTLLRLPRLLQTSISWRLLAALLLHQLLLHRRQTLLRRFELGEISLLRLELLAPCKPLSLWTQTLR